MPGQPYRGSLNGTFAEEQLFDSNRTIETPSSSPSEAIAVLRLLGPMQALCLSLAVSSLERRC